VSSNRVIWLPIFLLSGGALAYEVILVRLLAMTRFHHLAFMVLSLSLLAYGVSGVCLAYLRERLLGAFRRYFKLFAALFALGTIICFQLSQRIPIAPAQWVWSPIEAVNLVLVYLVLSLPLLFAAGAVGLAYCHQETGAGRIYRADLTGAAAGSLGALAGLWLPEAQALWIPWCAGLTAAALMAAPQHRRLASLCLLLALIGPITNPHLAVDLRLSPEKPLARALDAEGARPVADIFSPIGRLTVTRNPKAPYRHAPGLSLAFEGPVAAQWGLFTDGEGFDPLPGKVLYDAVPHLDFLPEALTYHLAHRERVLILGPPGMESLAHAIQANVSHIDLVLSNPAWQALATHPEMSALRTLLSAPGVHLTLAAPRGYLRTNTPAQAYDLIVLGAPSPASLKPEYRFTVEALNEGFQRLTERGALSLSGPSDLPPRAGLRLLTTAVTTLERAGATVPGDHLIMIRSLRTVHLIIGKRPLSPTAIKITRTFCLRRRFDPVWFPGMGSAEANRWNRLADPEFHTAVRELLGPQREAFQKHYKFDIGAVTDDRPYFSRFLKPAILMELFSLRGSGGLGMLSLTEPVLAATLIQALVLAIVLIWLPLRPFGVPHWSHGAHTPPGALFFLLGAGFMLAEFAVLEKLVLFLNAPVLAVGVTLALFLALAGVGGGLTRRILAKKRSSLTAVRRLALAATALMVIYLAGLPLLLAPFLGHPLYLRLTLVALATAPLALAMGLPFPLAIEALKRERAEAIPWAWGLNGCGALIGPVVGMGLAVYGGVKSVWVAAALCYALAAGSLKWRHRPEDGEPGLLPTQENAKASETDPRSKSL
jgi:hypothetical protein